MSSNKESETNQRFLHLYIAVRRHKDNGNKEREYCYRQIIRDEKVDLELLRKRCSYVHGIWRIYKTVNKRDTLKAQKLLMKKLIDAPDEYNGRIDRIWKTCLLQPECKGEGLYHIDIDTKDDKIVKETTDFILNNPRVKYYEQIETPNGYHVITDFLDSRTFTEDVNAVVNFSRDAVKFVDMFEIEVETGKK